MIMQPSSQPELLYVIGYPGVGKTTALASALSALPYEQMMLPFAHILYAGGVQLGRERGMFSGTDALALNVQPKAVDFMEWTDARAVVAEGDRLANIKFLSSVRDAGWAVTVALLEVDPEVARLRANGRGSIQNASWYQGRITKVDRLVKNWDGNLIRIDAAAAPAAVAQAITELPVIRRIRAATD